ncbi:MAG: ribosome maturation factor RimM [Alcaligenaceae bacterium]|nr:MAG: ribosome maturation factor RimM [Alcaligenaceae bacterium]
MSSPSLQSGVPGDLVELGRIVSAYGVRGWIKIQPFSPEADVLREARQWWLSRPVPVGGQGVSSSVPYSVKVERVRSQGSDLVAHLVDLDDRDQAEALKGHVISVSRALFPAADDDEVYWVDLIGCQVFGVDEQGAPVLIGEVSEVMDNGAHGVLKVSVLRADDAGVLLPVLDVKGRPTDTLIPYVAAHIQSVDLSARRIVSDWPADF